MRVYYQKKDIHKGCKAEVKKINPHVYEIEDNNCFVICLFNYTVYELIVSTFTFVVEVMFNLRTFSQVLATVINLFKCSILYFEMYINSLNVECKIYHKTLFFTFCLFKQRKMNKQSKTVVKVHLA